MFNADYMYLVETCGYLIADAIMEQEYCDFVSKTPSLYPEEYYEFDKDYKYYEAEIYNDEELYRMAKKF